MVESLVEDAQHLEKVEHSEKRKTGYEKNIPLYYLIQFFAGLHFFSGVLVPFFTEWGGISMFQALLIQAWFLGCVFLLEIPTGTIADFMGRKQSMVLGFLATMIGAFVYSSYPTFLVFMIGESIWAVGVSLMSGAQEAFLYDSLKEMNREEESKKLFGRTRSVGLVGILVAAPLGSVIASTWGLRYTMMLFAVPMGISVVLCLFLKEPKVNKSSEKQKYFEIIKSGFNHIRHSKVVKILAADLLVGGLVSYFVIWTYQQRLLNIGVISSNLGYINMIWLAVEILIANSFVVLEKILKSKRAVIFLSSLATGVGLIIMALASNSSVVVIGIILAAGFGLSRWILLINYINKHIPSEQRAMIISTIVMFKQLGHVILNPIVGRLIEWNLVIVLLILGGIMIVWSFLSPVREKHLLD
ncbi:MAG: MFS transporter [Promethearchaeota archaeon]